MKILYLPFILQGLIMSIDEFFHHKRGLPKWERVGHPLDTATAIIPFLYLNAFSYDPGNMKIYIALSAFSCLFITKDEWVHHQNCGAVEQWLHSLLFILHPLIFVSGGLLWFQGEVFILKLIPLFMGLFFGLQILRWSILWQTQKK